MIIFESNSHSAIFKDNRIGDNGAKLLAGSLIVNNTLAELYLGSTSVDISLFLINPILKVMKLGMPEL